MADVAQAERMIGWMGEAGVAGTFAAIVAALAISFLLVSAGSWLARRMGLSLDHEG